MRVGFVGLGTQGKGLALNAVQAGFPTRVYDIRPEPCVELARAGATVTASLPALARDAEVFQVCVLDDAQVSSVVGELIAGAAAGSVVAVHSTVRPATVLRLARAGAERGVEVIDVPVSGGQAGARRKTMSFMAGGSRAAFERIEPVLRASGRALTHLGPLGSGLHAKLAHQVVIALNFLGAYEGLRLGQAAGLPLPTLIEVIRQGSAQSSVAARWLELRLGPGAVAVFYKDLQLALELAHELGLSLPATALVQQMLGQVLPIRSEPPAAPLASDSH